VTTIRTLIVDDDYMSASVHRSYTERLQGFSVVGEAHTGKEALELVLQRQREQTRSRLAEYAIHRAGQPKKRLSPEAERERRIQRQREWRRSRPVHSLQQSRNVRQPGQFSAGRYAVPVAEPAGQPDRSGGNQP